MDLGLPEMVLGRPEMDLGLPELVLGRPETSLGLPEMSLGRPNFILEHSKPNFTHPETEAPCPRQPPQKRGE